MTEFYTDVVQKNNKILVTGYDKYGKKFLRKEDFQPSCFYPTDKKDTKYNSLLGTPLERKKFESLQSFKDYKKFNKDVANSELYGMLDPVYQFISDKFNSLNINKRMVHKATVDIETTVNDGFPDPYEAKEEITVLTYHSSKYKKYFVFTNDEYGEWDKKKLQEKHSIDIHHIPCKDEKTLLKLFMKVWIKKYPDIITGWNIEGFDLPYLVNRITGVLGKKTAKMLSPWDMVSERTKKDDYKKDVIYYDITGVSVIDYLAAYKKFRLITRATYKLDYIGTLELNTGKLDNPYNTFKEFYEKDYPLFTDYNVIDTYLVVQLEKKFKYLDLILEVSYISHINYNDVFSPIKTWDSIIFNELKKTNRVHEPNKMGVKDKQFEGAFVQPPKLGLSDWVIAFDIASLYPHIMMQYCISPENETNQKLKVDKMDIINCTRDNSDIPEGYCLAANGCLYKKDRNAVIPKLMFNFYNKRKDNKGLRDNFEKGSNDYQKYDSLQYAFKILINSLYGAVGSKYFRYYKTDNAEAVTLSGQASIRFIYRRLNDYINKISRTKDKNYIVAGDTDSAIFTLEDFMENNFADRSKEQKLNVISKLCHEKLSPFIDQEYDKLANYMGCIENIMDMELEIIADRAFWKAKKNYIMNCLDIEGWRPEEPKLKVKGGTFISSSIPEILKDAMNRTCEIIVQTPKSDLKETLVDHINDSFKAFEKCPPEDVCVNKSVKGLDKYSDEREIYGKGTPMHVRGSLLYNHYIKKDDLDKEYEEIKNGDKIKYTYMKMPNPLFENIISFKDKFPEKVISKDYIDHNLQFETYYEKTVTDVMEILGMTKEDSLEDLFD